MIQPVVTRILYDADGQSVEATCIRFAAYPAGAKLLAQLLGALHPLKPALDGAIAELRKKNIRMAVLAEMDSKDVLALLGMSADAGQALFGAVDALGLIAANEQLVADLLKGISLQRGGKSIGLTSQASIAEAIGYDYGLFGRVLWFAVEANFRGPLFDAFKRASKDGDTPSPAASP